MTSSSEICREIERSGVVAILRAASSGELIDVVKALREGGITCIEVTMTTPNALGVIAQAREVLGASAYMGVGTVLDAETARAAVAAGAQFVVAPIIDVPTVEYCRRHSVPVIPAGFSPTEIVRAWQAGADFVKVFPTGSVGAKYIKDLKGPLPQIKLIPTGGVDLNTIPDFIKAGASAVGAGTALVTPDAVKKKDFKGIAAAAGKWLERVKEARGEN